MESDAKHIVFDLTDEAIGQARQVAPDVPTGTKVLGMVRGDRHGVLVRLSSGVYADYLNGQSRPLDQDAVRCALYGPRSHNAHRRA